jgi:hypothetical protein
MLQLVLGVTSFQPTLNAASSVTLILGCALQPVASKSYPIRIVRFDIEKVCAPYCLNQLLEADCSAMLCCDITLLGGNCARQRRIRHPLQARRNVSSLPIVSLLWIADPFIDTFAYRGAAACSFRK